MKAHEARALSALCQSVKGINARRQALMSRGTLSSSAKRIQKVTCTAQLVVSSVPRQYNSVLGTCLCLAA